MNVRDAMTEDVLIVTPQTTIKSAAELMRRRNVGLLPVAEGNRPVGVLTDRDIVVRACAHGKDPGNTLVGEIMTSTVVDCTETESLENASLLMGRHRIRRLVVTSDAGHIVGVLSLGDLSARAKNPLLAIDVVREVSAVPAKRRRSARRGTGTGG